MVRDSRNWTPLGEVLNERREKPNVADLQSGKVKIVSKITFSDGKIHLRSDSNTKTGMILIRPGDLLISGINAAKGAVAIYEEENESDAAATIHYSSYMPKKDRVNIKYLWWLLRSDIFRNLLERYVPGGIKTELKSKRFLPIPVPIPATIEAQENIVKRIEGISHKISKVNDLGERVSLEIKNLWISMISRTFHSFEANGKLERVLNGRPRNGWSVRCDNADDGIAVLALSAVTGFYYRENQFKKTSMPTQPNAHYWLKPDDLLITRSNTPELVGHAAIYNGNPAPCIYPDLMMKLDINRKEANPKFVHLWLQTTLVRDYIKKMAKGTSPTMKKISQEIVLNIPFPRSIALEYQNEFVQSFEKLRDKLSSLEQKKAMTNEEISAVLPSLLNKIFSEVV